jgi:putative glycosyltransferase (TIGR04372 family)
MIDFIKFQLDDIYKNGYNSIYKKLKKTPYLLLKSILILLSFPIVLFIRIIKPIYHIRIGTLISSRIGHLAANTELYMCEKDAKINILKCKNYIDVFFLGYKPICNTHLVKMWKREIIILPRLILEPIYIANKLLPFGDEHEVGQNTQHDRDVHNLIEKYSPHLKFTNDEEKYGLQLLVEMGIQKNDKFVCLIVRDSAYLDQQIKNRDWGYHNYRDCDIDNYKLASEYLTSVGYYVIRMGAIVKKTFNTNNKKIIDYATSGMRNDFLDIYLGAKCEFCISSSLGWDAIPEIFKRPIVYTNILPLAYLRLSSDKAINLSKHFFRKNNPAELSLNQIFAENLAFLLSTDEYEKNEILLIENTPQEILGAVKDMIELISNNFKLDEKQLVLRNEFLKIFPNKVLDKHNNRRLHGKINGNYSFTFLKNNPQWLIKN